MYPDLPADLNRLKEEEEQIPYTPPYEAEQGEVDARHAVAAPGQDFDYTKKAEDRHPNVPDFVEDEHPSAGVDLRRKGGDQGDDELHGFGPEPDPDEEE